MSISAAISNKFVDACFWEKCVGGCLYNLTTLLRRYRKWVSTNPSSYPYAFLIVTHLIFLAHLHHTGINNSIDTVFLAPSFLELLLKNVLTAPSIHHISRTIMKVSNNKIRTRLLNSILRPEAAATFECRVWKAAEIRGGIHRREFGFSCKWS